jgi:hypothetical protein
MNMRLNEWHLSWGFSLRIPARGTMAFAPLIQSREATDVLVERVKGLGTRGLPEELSRRVVNFEEESTNFHRGDVNGDGAVDVSDGLCALEALYAGGAGGKPLLCLEAADVNNDGSITPALHRGEPT